MAHDDLVCWGPNYHPEKAPNHDDVRKAAEILTAHLDTEWISEGCEEDHAFGCPSCQAALLKRSINGLLGWLDDGTFEEVGLGPTDDILA